MWYQISLQKAEGLFFAFIKCCKHQLTAELTVFYFYFWTDFKDRDVIKSLGKVMERQDSFCILFPVVTSKIMFVLDP